MFFKQGKGDFTKRAAGAGHISVVKIEAPQFRSPAAPNANKRARPKAPFP